MYLDLVLLIVVIVATLLIKDVVLPELRFRRQHQGMSPYTWYLKDLSRIHEEEK